MEIKLSSKGRGGILLVGCEEMEISTSLFSICFLQTPLIAVASLVLVLHSVRAVVKIWKESEWVGGEGPID